MTLETGPGPVGLLVYVRPLELVIKLQAGSRRVGFELIFSRYRAVRVTGSVEKGQVKLKLGCIVCFPNRQEMKQYQYIGTCTHAQLKLRVKDKRQPHEVTLSSLPRGGPPEGCFPGTYVRIFSNLPIEMFTNI